MTIEATWSQANTPSGRDRGAKVAVSYLRMLCPCNIYVMPNACSLVKLTLVFLIEASST